MKPKIFYLLFLMQCYISYGNLQEKPKEIERLGKDIRETQKCSILISKLYLFAIKEKIIKIHTTVASDASKTFCLRVSLVSGQTHTKNLSTKRDRPKIDLEKGKQKLYFGMFPVVIKNVGLRRKRDSVIPLQPQIKGLGISTPNNDAYPIGKDNTKRENILSKVMNNINDILGRPKNNGNEIEKNYEDVEDPIKPELFTLRNHTIIDQIKIAKNGFSTYNTIQKKNLNRGKLNLKNLFNQTSVSIKQPNTKFILQNIQNDITGDALNHAVSEKNKFVKLTTETNLLNESSRELLINEVSTSFNVVSHSENNKNIIASNNNFQKSHEETNEGVNYKSNICKSSEKSKIDYLKGSDLKPENANQLKLLQERELKKDKHLKEKLQALMYQLFHYSNLSKDFWNFTFDFQQNEFQNESKDQQNTEDTESSYEYLSEEYDSTFEEIDLHKIMEYLKKFVQKIFKFNYTTEVLEFLMKSSFDTLVQHILNLP